MYLYETHFHTSPVSKCAKADVYQSLDFYKKSGFDGVFLTNHFMTLDNKTYTKEEYEENLYFYFSDYDKAVKYGKAIGVKVFLGVEISHGGTDFLIYGLEKEWYFKHPEIIEMRMSKRLDFLAENGAFISQAHPYRDSSYIDHIRLYPNNIHAVEIINGCRTDFENKMAENMAEAYSLYKTAGSDNHRAENIQSKRIVAMTSKHPLDCESDFIYAVKNSLLEIKIINIE
ncbi:MAG: PHP domain-containing protein [Clostridia bacterium]|nr:PHP domain-containing protein [Clostridia bacterium]